MTGDRRSVRTALVVAFVVATCGIAAVAGVVSWRTSEEPVRWRFLAAGPGEPDNLARCNLAPDQCSVSYLSARTEVNIRPYLARSSEIVTVACSDAGPIPVKFTNSVLWWSPLVGRVTARSESLPPVELPDVAIPRLSGVDFPGEVKERNESCGISVGAFPDFDQFQPGAGDQIELVEYGILADVAGGEDVAVASPSLYTGRPSVFDSITDQTVPLSEWMDRFAVPFPEPGRDVPLTTIWGAASGAVALLGAVMAGVAVPALGAAGKAERAVVSEKAARKRFFTGNPDPVITVDRDGVILGHSPAASKLLKVDDLDGRSVHEFAVTDPERHRGMVAGFHDNPSARGMSTLAANVTARLGDDTLLPVDLSLNQIEIDGEPVNVAVIRDATDRVMASEAEAFKAQAAQAQQILAATHHELNREIVQVGFAIDDLEFVDNPAEALPELRAAYARLEEGKDNVAALAQLGRDRVTAVRQTATAEHLKVLTNGMEVETDTVIPLAGVDRLILRTAVKTAARNSETHGQATVFRIITRGDRLELVDNGTATAQEILDTAWATGARPDGTIGEGLSIVRRVIDAHQAEGGIYVNSDGGVTIWVDFTTAEQKESTWQ